MGRNSVITKTGSTYKVTQGTAEFSDYRRWYLNSSGEALAFTNAREVARVGADGLIRDTSPIITPRLTTSSLTMAVNRAEDKAYILMRESASFIFELVVLTISDMSLSPLIDISVSSSITPLRAIISADEKIVWLGDNEKIYIMDLDGGNLDDNTYAWYGGYDPTMTMNKDGYIYVVGNNNSYYSTLYRYTINGGSLEKEVYSLSGDALFTRVKYSDGFVLGDYIYFLGNGQGGTHPNQILKIPTATWNDKTTWNIKNLETDYGITEYIAQFNASGADNYATFSCTIGGRQTVMQCNLDTLECLPARRVNYAEREIEYSNDAGKPIEKLGIDTAKANNCDWKGLLTSSKGATGSI